MKFIYSSLGIAKLPTHSNNHRKRLATQSRHVGVVGRPDDSNVFIIKLPPNPHYYSQTTSFKGANELNSIDDKSKKVRFVFVYSHSDSHSHSHSLRISFSMFFLYKHQFCVFY